MAEKEKQLICIGTSTGGPRALQHLLPLFPKDFQVPILIVQHMPPTFTKSLANRLSTLSFIHVKEAEEGEVIKGGTAYIAPGDFHMTVKQTSQRLTIHLDQTESFKGHRPSANHLFQSLTSLADYKIIAVVMTGMGSDGTLGLRKLKSCNPPSVTTIAESEKSCIVFGMPKSAIMANVIDEVVELEHMTKAIIKHLQ